MVESAATIQEGDIMFSAAEKAIFKNMIGETRKCLNKTNPQNQDDRIKCETAYFSELDNYTYHTHPVGIEYPSEIDKQTTAKHGKQYLVIGLVPTNEIVVWGPYPTYDKIITRFKV